jgi:hypothetical protein
MSLRLAPLPDDFERWKRLMNLVFLLEEDRLFEWLKTVQAAVEEVGRGRKEREAA